MGGASAEEGGAPGNWVAAGKNVGTVNGVVSSFKNNTDGVAGRLYITRNF